MHRFDEPGTNKFGLETCETLEASQPARMLLSRRHAWLHSCRRAFALAARAQKKKKKRGHIVLTSRNVIRAVCFVAAAACLIFLSQLCVQLVNFFSFFSFKRSQADGGVAKSKPSSWWCCEIARKGEGAAVSLLGEKKRRCIVFEKVWRAAAAVCRRRF